MPIIWARKTIDAKDQYILFFTGRVFHWITSGKRFPQKGVKFGEKCYELLCHNNSDWLHFLELCLTILLISFIWIRVSCLHWPGDMRHVCSGGSVLHRSSQSCSDSTRPHNVAHVFLMLGPNLKKKTIKMLNTFLLSVSIPSVVTKYQKWLFGGADSLSHRHHYFLACENLKSIVQKLWLKTVKSPRLFVRGVISRAKRKINRHRHTINF